MTRKQQILSSLTSLNDHSHADGLEIREKTPDNFQLTVLYILQTKVFDDIKKQLPYSHNSMDSGSNIKYLIRIIFFPYKSKLLSGFILSYVNMYVTCV